VVNSGTTTAAFQINDTGYYQVTYGLAQTEVNARPWELRLNNVSLPYAQIYTKTANIMAVISVIVQITTSGSQLTIFNNTGATATIANLSGSATIPAAYFMIVKLK